MRVGAFQKRSGEVLGSDRQEKQQWLKEEEEAGSVHS